MSNFIAVPTDLGESAQTTVRRSKRLSVSPGKRNNAVMEHRGTRRAALGNISNAASDGARKVRKTNSDGKNCPVTRSRSQKKNSNSTSTTNSCSASSIPTSKSLKSVSTTNFVTNNTGNAFKIDGNNGHTQQLPVAQNKGVRDLIKTVSMEEGSDSDASISPGATKPTTDTWLAVPVPKSVWSNEEEACFEYADDVHCALRESEVNPCHRPLTDYMSAVQHDINHNMRSILVDWLVEVAEEYKLSTQTLFLTVNYIDRLLSLRPVQRNRLQLLGITSMLVAAKYEEIYPPKIEDFVYISDNTYTKEHVLGMEMVLLRELNFKLSGATPWEFCEQLFRAGRLDSQTSSLAHYVLELFLVESAYIGFYPSIIAASAVFLARWTIGHSQPWTDQLRRACHYSASQLQPCVREMEIVFRKMPIDGNTKLKAVRDKFSHKKFDYVATIRPREPIFPTKPL